MDFTIITSGIKTIINGIVLFPLGAITIKWPRLIMLTGPLMIALSIPMFILGLALDIIGMSANVIFNLAAAAIVGSVMALSYSCNKIAEFAQKAFSAVSNFFSSLFNRSADPKNTIADDKVDSLTATANDSKIERDTQSYSDPLSKPALIHGRAKQPAQSEPYVPLNDIYDFSSVTNDAADADADATRNRSQSSHAPANVC